jgi:hypothetical protein
MCIALGWSGQKRTAKDLEGVDRYLIMSVLRAWLIHDWLVVQIYIKVVAIWRTG